MARDTLKTPRRRRARGRLEETIIRLALEPSCDLGEVTDHVMISQTLDPAEPEDGKGCEDKEHTLPSNRDIACLRLDNQVEGHSEREPDEEEEG